MLNLGEYSFCLELVLKIFFGLELNESECMIWHTVANGVMRLSCFS